MTFVIEEICTSQRRTFWNTYYFLETWKTHWEDKEKQVLPAFGQVVKKEFISPQYNRG
jgi:hypothetical protein